MDYNVIVNDKLRKIAEKPGNERLLQSLERLDKQRGITKIVRWLSVASVAAVSAIALGCFFGQKMSGYWAIMMETIAGIAGLTGVYMSGEKFKEASNSAACEVKEAAKRNKDLNVREFVELDI